MVYNIKQKKKSKSMKNATSLFLSRFLIMFVLSDRAWWGLQNLYTEF